jgi:alginate O-acetyltransferase complex protein AlgI
MGAYAPIWVGGNCRMAFSSNFFLFGFLPVVLALYFLSPRGGRNHVLLAASLVFYAFDAGWMIWILIASILFNHYVAQALVRVTGRRRQAVFAGAVAANLAVLVYYKYANFLWDVLGSVLGWAGIQVAPIAAVALPIGISFFTFQALSYIADVYTHKVMPERTLLNFGMYHSLFPQLIAGPIVRYVEVADAIHHRETRLDRAAEGICRFCIGLGKKLIIADTVGSIADKVFALPSNELTFAVAWLGLVCYTLQIYFDFSGYSDMAIGLGKLFGFDFPENFNQPYRARSITEFWRRWHMTLSRWFRDYVYIPLGGNRYGPWRTYGNLVIVFFLCGLWHGAAYTFVIWGLYHGVLLIIERLYMLKFGELRGGRLAWPTTLLLVMIGWVFFRSATLTDAVHYISVLFGLVQNEGAVWMQSYLTGEAIIVLCAGAFLALAPDESVVWRLKGSRLAIGSKGAIAITVFFYSVMLLSFRSFNPFIYFRF